jgi:hypothetical protein
VSVGGGMDTGVEVVGCLVAENKQRVGCFTPNGRYQACKLSTAWPLKMWGGGRRGSMWGGVDTGIVVVGCLVAENERRVGCFTPNGRY